MARITINIPETLHLEILKQSKKDQKSFSYTVSKLAEIGLLIESNKNKQNETKSSSKVEDYCHKLIIQMNEIIKELAVNNFQFSQDKINKIMCETLEKYQDISNGN